MSTLSPDLGWVSIDLPGGTSQTALGTLGPAGTSSEKAAERLRSRVAQDAKIHLYDTYEGAHTALRDGEVTHVVVANAFTDIHEFYMDGALALSDVFVMDTPLYGIVKRPTDVTLPEAPKLISHPSPVPLISELLPSGLKLGGVSTADSTSSAARAVAEGKFDLAMTTEPAAELYGLEFVSRRRPIRMVWSVFTTQQTVASPVMV
ncbi:prephenate dehydratase domain-containing protein [Streptomyces sp. NPDC058086]|uniref:prephenate dehydratase domain-containing protein n=1 Tax=Streptomyces sp. NPDC058086 TaxID=3346334 RepID=UPI0036E9FBCF